MNNNRSIAWVLVTATVLTWRAAAQDCDLSFDLSWNSIDNGGGLSIGDDLELVGTVGQTEVGEMTAGDLSLTGGFRFVRLPRPGDVDGNEFVDILDLEGFVDCMSGPAGGPSNFDCRFTDFDASATVDLADVAILQAAFGTRPPRPQVRWINQGGGSWENPTNWDAGFVPTDTHEAVVELDGTYAIFIRSDQSVGSLRLCNKDAVLRIAPPGPFAPSVTLTVEDGFTNHGIIELSSDSLDFSFGSTLKVDNGVLINAPGATIRATQGQVGGPRIVDAVVDNQGTIRVGMESGWTMVIQNDNRTFDSTVGTLAVELGASLVIDRGTSKVGSGTTFTGAGVIDWSGSPHTLTLLDDVTNQPGGTGPQFAFSGDVILDGPGMLTNEGALTFDHDTINTSLINHGMITTHSEVFLNGALSNLADGAIRIAPPGPFAPSVTFAVEDGFTNHGTIELSSDSLDSSFGSTLKVDNGVLINAPGATIRATEGKVGGPRIVDANVDNQGTIHVAMQPNRTMVIQNDDRTFDSTAGTLMVEFGASLVIDRGTSKVGSGTTFTGAGVIDWSGSPHTLTLMDDVTNQPGGTGPLFAFSGDVIVDGPGMLTNEGALTFDRDTINTSLVNNGLITTRREVFLNGPLSNLADGAIRIAPPGPFAPSVTLTVEDGFTNHGTIELSSDSLDFSFGSTLKVDNGVLINAPGATIRATQGQVGGPRDIDAVVDNQGTIHVQHAITISRAAANHLNDALINADKNLTILQTANGVFTNTVAGVIAIAPGSTVQVIGGSCNNDGVVMGAGTFVCD